VNAGKSHFSQSQIDRGEPLSAEGIAEAATRPTMRFVDLKSETQLDIQTLHRARDRLVGGRTALFNQLLAILLERGSTVSRGRHKLEQYLAALPDPENDTTLSPRMRPAGRGYARRMARAGSADRCFR
jgi:transposase